MGVHIAALGDAAAGTVPLSDEERGLLLAWIHFGVVQVYPAIAEFTVVQAGLLGSFTRQLADAAQLFAFTFVLKDAGL